MIRARLWRPGVCCLLARQKKPTERETSPTFPSTSASTPSPREHSTALRSGRDFTTRQHPTTTHKHERTTVEATSTVLFASCPRASSCTSDDGLPSIYLSSPSLYLGDTYFSLTSTSTTSLPAITDANTTQYTTPARVALLPPRGQADLAARGARPYSRRCRSSQGGRHRRARPPALAPHRFPSPSPARRLTPTSTSEYIARSTKGMVDASTVDCNAKEDDDEPGGEMCTDTTRTHFGLGPSSHTPTQRSSYYSLLFALAATILLSPLLLGIVTRPLAEPGALRLLRFGEIASGRQRVPATTTA
ncbi:hypothetical protein B0H13DRAFT_2333027 [Mycena leptocephala]|nr:hypothetical protein B0H13DRAFT_2333027 [Mycena leptocephala]